MKRTYSNELQVFFGNYFNFSGTFKNKEIFFFFVACVFLNDWSKMSHEEIKEQSKNITEEEIAVAVKVLAAVSYDRQLLTDEKFKPVLDQGKELFTPRT